MKSYISIAVFIFTLVKKIENSKEKKLPPIHRKKTTCIHLFELDFAHFEEELMQINIDSSIQ